jgi:hypothetical protein
MHKDSYHQEQVDTRCHTPNEKTSNKQRLTQFSVCREDSFLRHHIQAFLDPM